MLARATTRMEAVHGQALPRRVAPAVYPPARQCGRAVAAHGVWATVARRLQYVRAAVRQAWVAVAAVALVWATAVVEAEASAVEAL